VEAVEQVQDPYDEVVALRFGSRIVFNRAECLMRVDAGEPFVMVSRREMQMMAGADLGPQWVAAAQAPTLFKKSALS
jgi:hypothetical protein